MTKCGEAKKVVAEIRKRLRGAVNDLKKSHPRSASSKLFQAQELITTKAKIFRKSKAAAALRQDAYYVSMKLVNASTMNWPKWKDRAEAMLKSFNCVVDKLPCS
jgi:hypothetical protein